MWAADKREASSLPVQQLIASWESDPEISANIVVRRKLPARQPILEPFPEQLHANIAAALHKSGIDSLYAHQMSSWRQTQRGAHIVVVTDTASGKSLCYNLPILDRLLRDPSARALYLFPTKALAHDQREELQGFIDLLDSASKLGCSTYDGDTPAHIRPRIRAHARLLISNPDMLHLGILPHHTAWEQLFHQLAFVVIDEIHTYRGVFGSHMANVVRRLKRIAAFYDSHPQFILTSATIGNPAEHAQRLIETPVQIIDQSGAGRGAKHFYIYNPPIVNQELGIRRSAMSESIRLAQDLVGHNVQTILFGRTRRLVELTLSYLRRTGVVSPDRIRGYRSGYLPKQRREIEQGLREGMIQVVVATNALELGIDIGGMKAAVLAGYPGTIAGTWQQAGRAGRDMMDSLAVLIASSTPLDQFLAHHPDYFFDRSPEHALINPDHPIILLNHVRCAAFELAFHTEETFGSLEWEKVLQFLEVLENAGELHQSGDRYFWMTESYPAQYVSLRSASASRVLLQVQINGSESTIGEVDQGSVFWMVHPGAIYLHEAQMFQVDSLDLDAETAKLVPVEVDYYTEPKVEISVDLIKKIKEARVTGGLKAYGDLSVTNQVTGYQKVLWDTRERIDILPLELPETQLLTRGYWLGLDETTVEMLKTSGLWSNDPINYGPNWNRQRNRARARSGFRCQNCGTPEDGRSHHVHHKIPFRAFRSYEEANQLHNLIALCPSCHRRAEAVVRVRSGLSGLAHTLGHLAPLFLMCDPQDLGVHSDPKSPLCDDQPTVVIFDRVPAGIGFSERLFEIHDDMIVRSYQLVIACGCSDGCPSCVGPPGEAGFGGKKETRAILEALSEAGRSI